MYDKYKISYDLNKSSGEGKLFFQRAFFFLNGDYYLNAYFEKALYDKLKENIKKDRKIEFFNTDLLTLNNEILNKKYTTIFLSNVLDYLDDSYNFEEFLLKKLVPTLTGNGSIMYNYSWNSSIPYWWYNFKEIQIKTKEELFIQ